jgi:hypothetical protein
MQYGSAQDGIKNDQVFAVSSTFEQVREIQTVVNSAHAVCNWLLPAADLYCAA